MNRLAVAVVAAIPACAAAHVGSAAASARESGAAGVVEPTRARSFVARLVVSVTAREQPARDAGAVAQLRPQAPWNGGPVGLLVLGTRTDADGTRWLHVLLPLRPNGSTGWIRADRAFVTPTRWRIVVSLRRRTLRLLRDGRTVHRARVVVGARGTPTPTGLFAVAERVGQPDPDGFLGPWALHLTGFSDVLDDYGGGPGRVALHGRAGMSLLDPLGTARSHGCVRVPNATIRRLARRAREGTPVRIWRR